MSNIIIDKIMERYLDLEDEELDIILAEELAPLLEMQETVNELIEDLKGLGFNDPDEPVSGADCVDITRQYYNRLTNVETFPEGSAACPVCGSVYLDSDEAAGCCQNRRY